MNEVALLPGVRAALPSPTVLDDWLDRGLFLRVHRHLDDMRGIDDADMQGRVARALRHLGAERDGSALAIRASRRFPSHQEAVLSGLRALLTHQGPYAYWRATEGEPAFRSDVPAERARALSLHACFLGAVRDFVAARRCHEQALALCADDPWLWVEHAHVLEREDAYAASEAAAREALRAAPAHRAARQQLAHLLVLRGERAQAIELLERASQDTESGAVALQLCSLVVDQAQHERALLCLEQAQRFYACADRYMRDRLAALHADSFTALGRLVEAREHAIKVSGTGFYARLASRLEQPEAQFRRVVLPVNFVRQHYNTCAPATLASLAQFWGRSAEHLEIAEAICYDGTPAEAERRWADQQGFFTREFRLDWDAARALLDAGVPFALATQFVGSGHLQAVIGYDELRGTLLIRDPFEPTHTEFEAARLFDGQQSSGPRALLLIPPEQGARIAHVTLPEQAARDRYYALQQALERHDRSAAQRVLEDMRSQDGDAAMRWQGERSLALYDGDEPSILAGTEALLKLYPNDLNLQLSKATSLFSTAGQPAYEAYLETLIKGRHPEPLALIRLAARLGEDGRRLPRAIELTRRALRLSPHRGVVWARMATLYWNGRRQADALPLYRWAACLDATDENAAAAFARACHFLREGEQGIAFLRQREKVWGNRSRAPAITLFEQLDRLEHQDAWPVLRAALERRPDDADLKVYVASACLQINRLEEAEQLLASVTSPAHPASVLRARALLAERRGDMQGALTCAKQASELEPLNMNHHHVVVRLLARQEGKAAAIVWLERAVERHPGYYELHRLLYGWLEEGAASDAALARLHRMHPADPWTLRERAGTAARQGLMDQAIELAREACLHAPAAAESHGMLAMTLLTRDGYQAARPHLEQAIRLDVDYQYALRTLIVEAPDARSREAAVELVVGELLRQVTVGDALLGFQSIASHAMTRQQLTDLLVQANRERPDLWQSWVALARQHIELDQAEHAVGLLTEAAARFPSLPVVPIELCKAQHLLGRRDEALRAAERALAIAPAWGRAVRAYVDVAEELHHGYADAERVVRRALTTAPDEDDLIGLLAWLLEKQERYDEAFAEARRSLKLNAQADWIWRMARRVAAQLEQLALFDALLEEVTDSRPGDAWAWTVRAQHLRDDDRALAAAERALSLSPRLEEAWQARFSRLAKLSRYPLIETFLCELPWPGKAPLSLRRWGPRCSWHSGQQLEAIARQRALLNDEPNDELLWKELADWYDTRNEHESYERAARELVRVAPDQAASHAYLGHALVKGEKLAESIAPLRRALEIEPNYSFACEQLCKAASRTGDHALADWALHLVWPHEPQLKVATLGVQAACAAKDKSRALAWLERMFGCDEYDFDVTEAAIARVREAGWTRELETLQREHLERGVCPPGVGADFLKQSQARIGVLRTLWSIRLLLTRAEGPSLMRAVLRWLVATSSGLALRWFVWRHREALARDEETWGEVGYALLTLEYHASLRRWMAGWRERAQAPVWALHNLCIAFALRSEWPRIREVVSHALPRDPYDRDMRLWQLVLTALDGSATDLKRLLALRYEWEAAEWMQHAVQTVQLFSDLSERDIDAANIRLYREHGARHSNRICRTIHRQLRWRLMRRNPPLGYWRWLV